MKYIGLFLILMLGSCKYSSNETENAFKSAEFYCDCVNKKLANAKDSTINLNDCERLMFSKSRLLTIYTDFNNRDRYSQQTLDSASKFAIKVRDIEDSLCYNKIDSRKVKKISHAKM